jgi:hypothetical protein
MLKIILLEALVTKEKSLTTWALGAKVWRTFSSSLMLPQNNLEFCSAKIFSPRINCRARPEAEVALPLKYIPTLLAHIILALKSS